MPNVIPRLLRLNTSITIPQMTALEELATREGRHKAEVVRNALEVYFETKGIKIHGKGRHAALLSKKRMKYRRERGKKK